MPLCIYMYGTLLKVDSENSSCIHVTFCSTFQQQPSDTQVSTHLMEISERNSITDWNWEKEKSIITYWHWMIEIASGIGEKNSITYWNWVKEIASHIYYIFLCVLYVKIVLCQYHFWAEHYLPYITINKTFD